ncbi:MAG: cupin domain-containing protein [Acidiferrobacterales bacterium]
MKLSHYNDIQPYFTKDGSLIRELMHPDRQGNRLQSLAEATVLAGTKTKLHRHQKTEELYYIAAGEGWMTLGDKSFLVAQGDTICIEPGTPHCIENKGQSDLKILCCCTPPYDHEDTDLRDER